MCHGRPGSPSDRPHVRFVPVLVVFCAFLFSLTTGCGSADIDDESSDAEDRRTWSVDSQSDENTDAADEVDASSGEEATDNSSQDASSGDDTTSAEVRCDAGAADEAAFEGRTNDPATRVTVYVRDDCALVGSVAVSIYSGNHSLTLRGSIDERGNLTMAGRNDDHHADIAGAVDSDTAQIDVTARFSGTPVEHELTLERID